MKTPCLLAFLLGAIPTIVAAQDATTPDKIVESIHTAFEAGYAKADVPALVALFTDDAQFTSEEGAVSVGKVAIGQTLSSVFTGDPEVKLDIETRAARALAPGVIVENGYTVSTSKGGETRSSLFTAVYVQKDGKWKFAELVESPVADVTPSDYLAELDWLIGSWVERDPDNDVTVSSEYTKARGDNFLTRNVQVKRGDNPTIEGWQVIGWDPLQEQIRSWTFDSEGGFSNGYWTRSGNRWLIREVGYASDGSRNSADITITKVNADRLTWESNNRTLDGEPQPSLAKIEVSRVKGN